MISSVILNIADVRIKICTDHNIRIDEQLNQFISNESSYDIAVRFQPSNLISIPFQVSEISQDIQVNYAPNRVADFATLGGCMVHLPMNRILLLKNRFFLHSSLVKTAYGGVLFTGYSGIGKSTQAELWKRFRSAEILNGDRSILYRENDIWYASGSPYVGSSHYYSKDRIPIRCIVLLEQADRNTIGKVNGMQAYRSILQQVGQAEWTEEEGEKLLDHLENLIEDVPIYQLCCTPDERAVTKLEAILKGGSV